MIISVARSFFQKTLKKMESTWNNLKEKCSQTKRTAETVEEYKAMTREQQTRIKDVGGFVAGELKDGRRKTGHVISRCCLTYDLDHATPDVWDRIAMFFDFQCFLYSTHRHSPSNPRYRLVINLSRPVTVEEFAPVSRMVAKDIGMEMIDDCSHEPTRLMFWPSTSSDGEFVFKSQDGPALDPDAVLARYDDWHDVSQWPMSEESKTRLHTAAVTQVDPLAKDGVIGAFCRAYDIRSAVEKFLSNVYQPSTVEGRYDYIPAESSAGGVVYEDKFFYSHHATDPAHGMLLNAFDLVRVHLFGDRDSRSRESTADNKKPSFKAMLAFALADDKVRIQMARDRTDTSQVELSKDLSWQAGLELDKQGEVKASLTNLALILRNDPRLKAIVYNEHRNGISIKNGDVLPWQQISPGWNDQDISALATYLDSVYHIYGIQKLKAAVLTVAAERSYHPIREMLESLPEWDGRERLDTLFIDYLGADDNNYNRAVTRKTLVAAIARIFEPGVKFDQILVLVGNQGIGKSTIFYRLAGSYYSDSLSISDMRDKTAPEKLQGYWIVEISEMNGIRKVEAETVKSFASRQDDKYRAAYGMTVENHPRQCIIVGTTNSTNGFLRDVTGNRRFWPVNVSGNSDRMPWELDKKTVDQIWAEALYRYRQGEELILTGKEADIALQMQHDAMEHDDREGLVRTYLDTLIPDNWNSMSLSERRQFLEGDGFIVNNNPGTTKRDKVCNMELWAECFGKDPATMKKQDSYELSAIMSKVEGWIKYDKNKSGKLSFGPYGSQLAYIRSDSVDSETE